MNHLISFLYSPILVILDSSAFSFAHNLIALPWLLPYLSFFRPGRREPKLSAATPATGKLVSIVLPARNESRTIATAVRSILQTTYEPIELLVVDDMSTDDTAAIVSEFARQDPRVKLIEGTPLPVGWFGKPWACWQGYRATRGDIILFTDADTRHEPALLAHAVGALEQERADLVTVAPRQRCETLWERLVMPLVWSLLSVRFHPRLVNRARQAREVIANGQFIMATREGYEAAGTHQGVRDQVAEDLALAQNFFRARRRIHFAFATDLMETRMYQDLPHLVEGWSKNLYLGSRQSFPDEPLRRAAVPLSLLAGVGFLLAPPAVLLTSLSGLTPSLLVPSAIATGLSVLFWMLFDWEMDIPPAYGIGYPLGGLALGYIVVRSIWRGARRVEWKGRVYGGSGEQ